MPRLVLPLGRWAPWVLAAVAVFLVVLGLFTRNREMLAVGAVAGGVWIVAFPVARAMLGPDEPGDEGS